MGHEVEEIRSWLRGLLQLPSHGTVLDIGCGDGKDVLALAQCAPQVSFIGIDGSAESIHAASEDATAPNVMFDCVDVSNGIPFDDSTVDSIYSVNLLECLPDKAAFVRECARVLRPKCSIVVGHFDWDTQTFDGEDQSMVRRVVHAYNDWQQDWMKSADPWTGRRLKRHFSLDSSFVGEVRAHTLICNSFEPGSYGRGQAESFESLVRRGLITRDEYESFMRFQQDAAATDTFFYSVTMFAFVGMKL
jgi:SAM-dependent methyltransferase